MKPVFSYIDYREYIQDFYEEKKKESRFSYRDFSRLAGYSSPVFIKLVIEGKANVSKQSITKLCNAMGLNKEEKRYYKNLVLFSQAKDLNTKMHYLDVMRGIQSTLTVNKLSNEQYEYFSKWYHPVIKELLDCIVFDGDYEKLAKLVNPQITAKEAEESVELLKKLNLIKEENGQFTATQKFVSTSGLTIGTLAVRNVQKKMAALAANAIDSVPKDDRDISGLSVSVSQKSITRIQEELARCRRRIMEIASKDAVSNAVYRVNLHLFPVSNKIADAQLKVKRIKK